MKHLLIRFFCIAALSGTFSVWANQCEVIFPDGASIHDSEGKITINRKGKIKKSPDNILDTPELEDKTENNEDSCDGEDCRASGQTVPKMQLSGFEYSTSQHNITVSSTQSLSAGSYANITVRENKKLKLTSTGVYKIKNLVLEYKATLEIEDSILWVETLVVKEKAKIKYKGDKDNTTLLYVLSLVAEKDSDINDKYPSNLVVASYGHVTLKEDSEIEAYLYAQNKVTLEKDAKVKGAVTAEIIEIKEDAEIDYEDKDLDELDVCIANGGNQPLPDPIAYWPVDLCRVNGTQGELVDIVGGYNGRTVDGADTDDNARFCQGLKFSGDDDHANIPHYNAFALEEGAIAFWFKSDDVNYSHKAGRGGQGLFSKDSRGTDNGSDHLTIWIDNNQKIFVRHQVGNNDNNIQGSSNINSNQWHHVVYSWGGAGMRLYVDGNLDEMRSANGDIDGNPEPIILGANAWLTGNGRSDSNDLKDMFKGSMDEVQLFDEQLSDANVTELYGKSSYSCEECVAPEPVLVGHWKGNVCALDGSNGEVIDAINGNHGRSIDGAGIEDDGRLCQAFSFNGDDAHINIPHADEFALQDGTVSFWFKVDDLSNSSDPSHGGQGLFSKDSSGWNAGGEHLTIWVRENGSIRVRHQLENGNNNSDKNIEAPGNSVEENTWYHLVYSWGSEGMALYLNGELKDSDSNTRGIASNPEPIILGANAWVTENYGSSSNLKDKFAGEIDDLRLYSGQLDEEAVEGLYVADNPDSCVECNPDPILTSRWPFDVCDIDENEDAIVDIISGNNGTPKGDLDADISAVLCQGAEFNGDKAHVDVPHTDEYATEEGAVSLWFKVNDFASYRYWDEEDDDNDDRDDDDDKDKDKDKDKGDKNASRHGHGRGHGRGHNHGDDHDDDDGEDIQTLLSKSARGNGDGGDFVLAVTSHGELVVRYETEDDDFELASDEGSLSPDTWYHAMFTFGDDGLRLYLNGQLVDRDDDVTTGLENNIERLIMASSGSRSDEGERDHDNHDGHRHKKGRGHYHHGRGHGYGHHHGDGSSDSDLRRFLNGALDDVRFYSRQQPTDAEVLAVYSETDDSCDNCAVEQPELIAHYPSDVCSIDGTGGNYVDIVNGYNGTFIDGVALSDGKFCNAVAFGGDDEHINIPHQADFELDKGAVAFWIYVPDIKFENGGGNTSHDGQALFSKDSRGTDNGAGHLTIWLRNDGDIRVRHQIGSKHIIESTDEPVTESNWHHIAYTWGPNGKRLYVDGDLKARRQNDTGGIIGNREPIILGANASITGDGVSEPSKLRNWFNGKMDDVRIYGTQQPNAEFIEDLYQTEYQCLECSNSLAHYKFEESNWSGSGSVIDSAGNFNGTNLGGITPIAPNNPISCQVMDVPFNDDDDDIDALDTTIDPQDDIGDKGTISFWFRADTSWNDGARVLFDASSGSVYFYANITSSGRLRFAFEDEDDRDASVETGYLSFGAGEWVHLAFTWDLNDPRADIYVNGVRQATQSSFPNDFEDEFGDLRSLYIGDNRGDYHPNGSDNSAHGQFDDVRIYSTAQSAAEVQADARDVSTCVNPVHHYELSFETPASVCTNPELTVRACADEQCSSLAAGTQSVDIQYVVDGTYQVVVNDLQLNGGVATYSNWGRRAVETGTLQLSGENPAGQNAYQCDPDDCQISFDYILEINYGGQDTDIPTQIAEAPFSQQGQAQVTVKKPDSCPLLDDPVPLLVAIECIDPAICSGNSFEIGGPNSVTITPSNAGANLNYVLVDASFDGTETALSDLIFNDVGRIKLHVDAGGALDSKEFVVKPSYLALSDSISTTHTAGVDFTMSVSAYGANGGLLPNYQSDRLGFSFARVLPESVASNGALLNIDSASNQGAPLALSDGGTIDSFNEFDSGVPQPQFSGGSSESFTARLNEVGQFAVDVQDADYLGVGGINSNRFGANPANMVVGRFIPAYFTAELEHRFQGYCGDDSDFAYRGGAIATSAEGHTLTLTAYNALNSTTRYYDADVSNYFYYNTSKDFNGRSYIGGGSNTITGAPAASLMASFSNDNAGDGRFRFVLAGDTITVGKSALPDIPWMTGAGSDQINLNIDAAELLDNDGVGVKTEYADVGYLDVISGPVLDGMEIRDGRIAMENIFGSNLNELTVILQTQYFNDDSEWVLNESDSCTLYDGSYIESLDSNYQINAFGAGTFVEGQSQQGGDGAVFIELDVEEDDSGEFDVQYTIPDHQDFLRFDWDGDGEPGSPTAKIIFGINRGNDRIIHWREVY